MPVASIDIGTNTVLLLVAEKQSGALQPMLERATVTRLGEGVDRQRRLLDAAAERTLACLQSYAEDLRRLGVTRLGVVGTSALRDVHGATSFLSRASDILGVAVRVIDGQEEARLTFVGALSELPVSGKVTVFDIGGGSTEIVTGSRTGDTRSISRAVSLDIGSVRLFERHVHSDPVAAEEMRRVERDIALALAAMPELEAASALVGAAGTLTQLAALERELTRYDGPSVHGSTLSYAAVARQHARLASLDVAARRALPGMEPARADVIVVGSAIALAVLDWSHAAELVVSDRGVRWGLAAELAATASGDRA